MSIHNSDQSAGMAILPHWHLVGGKRTLCECAIFFRDCSLYLDLCALYAVSYPFPFLRSSARMLSLTVHLSSAS